MLVKMCISSRQVSAVHTETGRVTKFIRSKGVFEIDAEVLPYRLGPQRHSVKSKTEQNVKTLPSWRPLKCQWTSLPSADASRSDRVPEVEVEQPVGSESEEPVNVRPLRAPWEPTKEEQDIHETSGHAQFRARCRSCFSRCGQRHSSRAS